MLAHALSDGTGPFLNPPLLIPSPSPFHAGDHKICGCLAKLHAERIYGTVEGFFRVLLLMETELRLFFADRKGEELFPYKRDEI